MKRQAGLLPDDVDQNGFHDVLPGNQTEKYDLAKKAANTRSGSDFRFRVGFGTFPSFRVDEGMGPA
ncbi:MAG: hypothetical protein HUU10_15350 [Bacteroidetes bacterium]|nr:hypothetical protein [Bacteroidota bacterium]